MSASAPRILVVGASGMFGHEAIRVLAPDFEVWGSCRSGENLPDLGIPAERLLSGLDATEPRGAYELLDRIRPDMVINAIGIVKQLEASHEAIPSIQVNSLWPHVLSDACRQVGARMVHLSTDCVFSGARGGYTEADIPDAADLYGRSKLLGEVAADPHTVTLRTSIIGWQLGPQTSLVGWFAAHRHEKLTGYRRAVFSGLTTTELTRVIRDYVLPNPAISGLYQVSADPIDKYTLLRDLAAAAGWDVDLTPVDSPVVDKSLDSSAFRAATCWTPPSWETMLAELAATYRA